MFTSGDFILARFAQVVNTPFGRFCFTVSSWTVGFLRDDVHCRVYVAVLRDTNGCERERAAARHVKNPGDWIES